MEQSLVGHDAGVMLSEIGLLYELYTVNTMNEMLHCQNIHCLMYRFRFIAQPLQLACQSLLVPGVVPRAPEHVVHR